MSAQQQFSLKGKVAIITGAGNGIGSATAKLFTELGAAVSLLDLDEDNVRLVAKQCEEINGGQPKPLVTVGCVTRTEVLEKCVEDTVKTFGKLDALVNNAGTTKLTSLLNCPLADYDLIFNVNVRAIVELTKIAAPHLMKTRGSVVSLSSAAGSRVVEGRLFYGMSKATVKAFTQYTAYELGKHKIRVNCISPGMVRTNILLNYGITKKDLPQYFEETGRNQPMERCAEPLEIARLIAFLSSDWASYITGVDYHIDGGQLVQPTVMAGVSNSANSTA